MPGQIFALGFVLLFAVSMSLLGYFSKKRKIVYLKGAFVGLATCAVGMLSVLTGESFESIFFLEYRLGFAKAFPVGLAIFLGAVGGYLLRSLRDAINSRKENTKIEGGGN